MITVTIPGHCYSLKNHRPILRKGRGGAPFLGKSVALKRYQKRAVDLLKEWWDHKPPLETYTGIWIKIRWYAHRPDALGPTETVFDCLELAGVVADDYYLVPIGVSRQEVKSEAEEEVCISLFPAGEQMWTA